MITCIKRPSWVSEEGNAPALRVAYCAGLLLDKNNCKSFHFKLFQTTLAIRRQRQGVNGVMV